MTSSMSQPDAQTAQPTVSASEPPAEEAFEWARAAMRKGEWHSSAQRWAALRRLYPDYSQPWIQGGIAARRLELFEQAAALLAEARQRFPQLPEPWIQSAEVAMAETGATEAEALLEQARNRFPDEPNVWLKSADIASRAGNRIAARRYNDHVRDHDPEYPAGFVQRAELAMAEQDWESAKEYWREVREHFPDEDAGYIRGAELYEQLGETRQARRLRLARQYGTDWLRACESDEPDRDGLVPAHRRNLRNFLDLVWTKARFNLKSEASRNQLSYIWWILEPLLFMGVFYVVFALLLQRGGADYVPYLLTGLMPFQWFAKAIQTSSNAIMGGRGVMNSVRVSPLFFPLVSLTQASAKQIPIFVILSVLVILTGQPLTVHWLALAPVILLQLYLLAILSCSLAMLIPFFRDLDNLVPIGIRFTLFISGIFYSVSIIPDRWLWLFFLNPMATLFYQYRLIMVEQSWPDWSMCGALLSACVIASLVMWWAYCKLERVFPRVVLE